MRKMAAALALIAALGACAADRPVPQAVHPTHLQWREVATEADRSRLRNWRTAWVEALDQARANGFGDDIAKEGILLDPDAALANPGLPSGTYRCRTVKVGSRDGGTLAYVAYPFFRCRIAQENGRTRLTKLTGSQRPVGTLYPDTPRRQVFLGTLQLGDEQRLFQYGIDRDRDMAGLVERIDERRWRLVLPYPRFESTLDVIELLPGD